MEVWQLTKTIDEKKKHNAPLSGLTWLLVQVWREKEGDLAAQWADSGSLGAHFGAANRCYSGKPPPGIGGTDR
jgi:hypothetical protein